MYSYNIVHNKFFPICFLLACQFQVIIIRILKNNFILLYTVSYLDHMITKFTFGVMGIKRL